MTTKIKISLDLEDFETLVNGNKIARLKTDSGIETEIILQDIGYEQMIKIIQKAINKNA